MMYTYGNVRQIHIERDFVTQLAHDLQKGYCHENKQKTKELF